MLLDCGTYMKKNALSNMIEAFETDKKVAGVTGFLGILKNYKPDEDTDDNY